MKRKIVAAVSLAFVLAACNHSAEINKADPLESGRGFIEASLKGDYVEAKKYILEDSTNLEYFNGLKDFNGKMSSEERHNYRDANIIIDSTHNVSDSVVIITYSNTYKNVPSKLKMLKHNNEWLVDFKFTFNDNL
ncbi:MAG: hypothetical protein M3Z26_12145 [Bacteroidota bacterium]|nr:hypothetical protein [Bacteroidota bacterium]